MTKRVLRGGVFLFLLLITASLGLTGCGDHSNSLEERMHNSSGEKGQIEREKSIAREWTQRDTVAVETPQGALTFILARTKSIEQYPCGNCHVNKSTVKSKGTLEGRRAHWNIDVDHGSPSGKKSFNCSTCHASGNPETLTTPGSDTVSLNRSHQLCADCHQKQVRDWKGGAHGKRRSYWQGPRVIYSCAECHNPHDPALKKRWPVTVPSIPRKYGRSEQ